MKLLRSCVFALLILGNSCAYAIWWPFGQVNSVSDSSLREVEFAKVLGKGDAALIARANELEKQAGQLAARGINDPRTAMHIAELLNVAKELKERAGDAQQESHISLIEEAISFADEALSLVTEPGSKRVVDEAKGIKNTLFGHLEGKLYAIKNGIDGKFDDVAAWVVETRFGQAIAKTAIAQRLKNDPDMAEMVKMASMLVAVAGGAYAGYRTFNGGKRDSDFILKIARQVKSLLHPEKDKKESLSDHEQDAEFNEAHLDAVDSSAFEEVD